MKILVLGAGGMLGGAVARSGGDSPGAETSVVARDHAACDITDAAQVRLTLAETRPDAVILCAAWTNVDGAEADPAGADRVNGEGAGIVARACAEAGATILYPSTDYVFDGEKEGAYAEDDPPAPINAYGRSKLLGERRIREAGGDFLIARTSWVFGPRGKHFVGAILARARSGTPLEVVHDQVGSPTYAPDLAQALLRLAATGTRGVLNVTNAGWCSWHAFAERIVARAGLDVPVRAIGSDRLVRAARRPRNSRLDPARREAQGIALPTWEDALDRYLGEIGAR